MGRREGKAVAGKDVGGAESERNFYFFKVNNVIKTLTHIMTIFDIYNCVNMIYYNKIPY